MSAGHLRFLLLEQGIGAAVINFLLNGAIAWLLFRSLERVPLWGQQSIAGDTLGTCFFLPFLTTLIVTPLVRRRVSGGTLDALGWTRETHRGLGWLPSGTGRRALVLGGVCVLIVGPLSVWVLGRLDVVELTFWSFVAFKAAFAAALGLLVTPIISLWAMTTTVDRVEGRASPQP
jgi:hypothetical protein